MRRSKAGVFKLLRSVAKGWVNKVGAYGMASTQLYWAALLLEAVAPHVLSWWVFVDDFCWLLPMRGPGGNQLVAGLRDAPPRAQSADGQYRHGGGATHHEGLYSHIKDGSVPHYSGRPPKVVRTQPSS